MAILVCPPSKTPLLLLFFLLFANHANARFAPTYYYSYCEPQTYDPYRSNKLSTTALLSDLASHSSSNTYYHSSSSLGGKNTTTYGFFYCTGYVSSQDCQTCVQTASTAISGYCSNDYNAAMIVYEECTLRYSNLTVYPSADDSIYVWYFSVLSVDLYSGFNETLSSALNDVISQAASTGYATSNARLSGTTKKIYTLAQCTPDILGNACRNCLQVALQEIPYCCNTTISSWEPKRSFIYTFLPSCQLRYALDRPPTLSSSSSSFTGSNIWYIILALVVATIALH